MSDKHCDCLHADPRPQPVETLALSSGGCYRSVVPQEIQKQVILEPHLESLQPLTVTSYPLPLCRVPPGCHLLFIFAANTPVTSYVELINRAALVSTLLCVTDLTGSSLPTNKTHHILAFRTISALALIPLSGFTSLYVAVCLYSCQIDVPFILIRSL